MFGMLRVKRAQLDFHSVARERGAHPAARTVLLENIAGGRQVDEVHAGLMCFNVPVVRVAENKRLHLALTRE